jgi:multidrug efflux pump subunit AcrB
MGSLGETPVASADGLEVALKGAGRAWLDHSPARLNRRNSQRVVEVYAEVAPGTLASQVIGQLDPWLKARAWPPGTGYGYAGEAEETAKSFRKLAVAAFGAVTLIFLLLVLMFDSLLLSGLLIVAVPYVLVGVLPGLALTGNAFGFMAFLGLIALIGVYVNHKIYFVDRMLELMRRGDDLPAAILHAGADRLRPVVLTALTAVLGLVPLTLSGRMWAAFGWVNIFGLVASIPLSLLLLPAFIALAWRWTGRDRNAAPATTERP